MAHPRWPFFDLRIRTPRLELRPDWDEGLLALAEVAAAGVHDPGFMPFEIPWTDGSPEERAASTLQWAWRQRADLTPEAWNLTFVVACDGEVVGSQSMIADRFACTKEVKTGSWLGQRFQGRGIGKEMRAAVLHLAFAGLGADAAHSGAFSDNAASLGVSRALGYEPNGEQMTRRGSEAGRQFHLRLTRERWEQHRPPYEIEVEGLEPCLPLLGAEPR